MKVINVRTENHWFSKIDLHGFNQQPRGLFLFHQEGSNWIFFVVCSASMRLDWMKLEFMIKVNLENLLFHEERTEIGFQEQ